LVATVLLASVQRLIPTVERVFEALCGAYFCHSQGGGNRQGRFTHLTGPFTNLQQNPLGDDVGGLLDIRS
jgi:hypothetical protein